jgi:triosephosphate isomerase
MLLRKRLIVANWKMNPPSLAEARAIFSRVKHVAKGLRKAQVVICPPLLYLSDLAARKGSLSLGAQNIFWQNGGAFTGEVSPEMVRHAGARYAIVGHSERRALGESERDVSRKLLAVLREELTPILCVGERERDLEGGYLAVLEAQIRASLTGVPRRYAGSIIVAYEPVWAIGKSEHEALQPRGLHEMAIFIRKALSQIFDHDSARGIPILYGGSVGAHNAAEIVSEGAVAGLLVGHMSLDGDDFAAIIRSVSKLPPLQ